MKTKALILTLLTLSTTWSVITAQPVIGLNIPNVNLHSPEVNGLGKYGDYPADPSTGVVPVNIPLYTIKTAKLEFPISLSYHASGIKVEDEASNIGLGWTLNASGVITRQIKDKPDEGSHGFLYVGNTIPNYNAISPMAPAPGITGYADSVDSWFESYGYDKEPDLFNILTPVLTGEFACDNTGKFVSTIFDSLKYNIQLVANTLVVTDKKGVVYRFGMSLDYIPAWESSSTTTTTADLSAGSATTSNNYVNSPLSWYLTEIISADKSDTIRFRYKTGFRSAYRAVSQSQNVLTEYTVNTSVYNKSYTTYLQETSNNLQIINKITFKNGSIQFYNATDRQDMDPDGADGLLSDTRITGFAVYDNQNNVIRKVAFDNNDYFNRTGTGGSVNDVVFGNSYFKKSLKLDSVDFYDKNGAFVYNYKFQYDNTPLPPRGSTSFDYWGYYNGKPNSSLIPSTWYNNFWTGAPQNIGGDRSTDFNFMKAASLIQVTYPTGGYTEFGYEPNYYLLTSESQPVVEETRSVNLEALQSTGRDPNCTLPIAQRSWPTSASTQFTVNENVENSIATLYVHFSDFEIVNNSEMTATVTDLTNGAVYSYVQDTHTMTQEETVNQTINFYSGHTYSIEINTNAVTGSVYGWCDAPYIEFGLSYKVLVPQPPDTTITPVEAGGLRIKAITNFNTDNNIISQKLYTYGDTAYGQNLVGVGTLISDPSNSYYNSPLLLPNQPGDNCDESLYPFTWYTSNSIIDLGLNDGSPVFYSKVTEQTVSTNDPSLSNGKTEYYYDAPKSYRNPLPGSKYPYTAFVYPDWGRSNMTKKIDYKLESENYVPVHEIDYSYQVLPENRIKTLKVEEMQPEVYSCNCSGGGANPSQMCYVNSSSRFFFYNFYVSGGRIMKTGETETDYSDNGSLTSTRNYSYNGYYDLSGVQTTDSRQRQVGTSYKYTGDLNYSTLIAGNMVSLPTMEETTVDGQVRSGSILKYDNFGDVNSRYAFNSSSPTTPIPYTDYTTVPSTYERKDSLSYEPSHNNLREIDKDNSFNTAYLWDYFGQCPIAEVKNAEEADIAYTSFEADGTGNWYLNGGTVDTTQAITGRNSYQNGTITASGLNPSTTYIVSYWSQNGAYTIPGTISGYPMQGKTISFHTPAWTLYVHKVTGQNTITVNATGHIDELRLYPATAQMTTYTYDPLIGMTSQMDAGSRATYYEYDGLQRLKRIQDQDYNILKTIDYAYQAPAGCGSGCYSVAMQTFAGTNTLSYPVGVFDVNGNLVGNATNAAAYVTLWNGDTADARVGTLARGTDSMHFNIAVNAGQTLPASVTGLRYYQVDLAWNMFDAVRSFNGAYIDFGDGTGIRMPSFESDTPAIHPPNTQYIHYHENVYNYEYTYYYPHFYPDTSVKTITCYHNDTTENTDFDNWYGPATSLTLLRNLRGNLPQHTNEIGGSCYQQAGMTNLQGILNWNSITSVKDFRLSNGDGQNPCLNISYPQDFMAGNKGLISIITIIDTVRSGMGDPSFRLSRLKTDWNTYFSQLQTIEISDRDWNHEDLSQLTQLNTFVLIPSDADGGTEPGGPYTPLTTTEVDNIINQIARGAGQSVRKGLIDIRTGGGGRTSASQAAVNQLNSMGWTVYIDSVTQVTQ